MYALDVLKPPAFYTDSVHIEAKEQRFSLSSSRRSIDNNESDTQGETGGSQAIANMYITDSTMNIIEDSSNVTVSQQGSQNAVIPNYVDAWHLYC